MRVNEIFTSIEGEGIRAGRLCTFIRFTGCNLRCSWCDTTYAFDEGREMSVPEILDSVHEDAKCVTVTCGEPLFQDADSLMELTDSLIARGTEVNFETNGSVDFSRFMKDGTIITADYKLPSSGMSSKMDMDSLSNQRGCDVLKFVAADDADLKETERILDMLRPACHVFISPVFGRMDPKRLVEWLKGYAFKDKMDIRIQIQLHKAVWPPDARGV